MSNDRAILDEQIQYYRARASEYDEWFLRLGRYDRGEAHRAAWFAEVAEVEAALQKAQPHGDILELACGTGLWTQHLARAAARLTAIDASPEVIELNRQRVASADVEYIQTDLFDWQPSQAYDFVFFGFWLSHIPETRFEAFWRLARKAIKPEGTVFFVDSGYEPAGTAKDQQLGSRSEGRMERKLNDGRAFEIVKIFYEPPVLQQRLAGLGWRGRVTATSRFFIYGCLQPEAASA